MISQIIKDKEELIEISREALNVRKNPVKLTFENVKFEVTLNLSKKEAKVEGS